MLQCLSNIRVIMEPWYYGRSTALQYVVIHCTTYCICHIVHIMKCLILYAILILQYYSSLKHPMTNKNLINSYSAMLLTMSLQLISAPFSNSSLMASTLPLFDDRYNGVLCHYQYMYFINTILSTNNTILQY